MMINEMMMVMMMMIMMIQFNDILEIWMCAVPGECGARGRGEVIESAC